MSYDWNRFTPDSNYVSWEKPGDKVTGTLKHLGIGSGFGREYPELTIITTEGEKILSAAQVNLIRQLQDDPPALGDGITVEFLGEGEARGGNNPAKLFRVTVEHRSASNVAASDLV